MFWFSRPAYIRWALAALILVAAAVIDLAGRARVPYPFLTSAVPTGAVVTPSDVTWRDIPAGLLPPAPAVEGAAAVDLSPGDPLLAASLTTSGDIPPGWWSVPVELPDTVGPGTAVRLVAVDPAVDTEGIVAHPATTGTFAMASPGLVAVPPETAGSVAVAAANGTLLVLIGT